MSTIRTKTFPELQRRFSDYVSEKTHLSLVQIADEIEDHPAFKFITSQWAMTNDSSSEAATRPLAPSTLKHFLQTGRGRSRTVAILKTFLDDVSPATLELNVGRRLAQAFDLDAYADTPKPAKSVIDSICGTFQSYREVRTLRTCVLGRLTVSHDDDRLILEITEPPRTMVAVSEFEITQTWKGGITRTKNGWIAMLRKQVGDPIPELSAIVLATDGHDYGSIMSARGIMTMFALGTNSPMSYPLVALRESNPRIDVEERSRIAKAAKHHFGLLA